MLEAASKNLELARALRPYMAILAVQDAGLADQLKRAINAVQLQLREGSARSGRDQNSRYRTAAGEAQEVKGALEMVDAWGYVPPQELTVIRDLADHVAGLTYGLAYPRGTKGRRVPRRD